MKMMMNYCCHHQLVKLGPSPFVAAEVQINTDSHQLDRHRNLVLAHLLLLLFPLLPLLRNAPARPYETAVPTDRLLSQ